MQFMATINIENYKVSFTDQIFLDTNIRLLLFGTFAGFQAKEQRLYAIFFENLLQKQTPVFITSMVVSEFSNVLLRRDFNQWVSTNKLVNQDFKKNFVGTTSYKESVSTITVTLNKILNLPNVVLVGDNFNAIDKNSILNNFKHIDFNDSYYIELAILNKYKIVTHDKDFQSVDVKIDVLTANLA
jgi:predicted nucleic acid-binding protein